MPTTNTKSFADAYVQAARLNKGSTNTANDALNARLDAITTRLNNLKLKAAKVAPAKGTTK